MYTTTNCTSGTGFDNVILCCDNNCRHHESVCLLTVDTENEADKIIYALVARNPGIVDSLFKFTVIRGQQQWWHVNIDKPLSNDSFASLHEYCQGVRDALHIKFP